VYIQPDYCLSDIYLFDSFIRPFGDPKKSRLGSKYRIRAVKFNLHTGDLEPTYSVGILLPLLEVSNYLCNKLNINADWAVDEFVRFAKENNTFHDHFDIVKELGITKWEESDNSQGIKSSSGKTYPSDMYHTDEKNIANLWKFIENNIGYPRRFILTEKIDGSSISIIVKNGKIQVASRNYIKKEKIEKITGRRDPKLWEKILSWFGYKPDLLIKEIVDNDDDDFIKLAKPYIDQIRKAYGDQLKNINLIFRGEANGEKWKGSGNKNNPVSKKTPNIKFYGIDDYSHIAIKLGEEEFSKIINFVGFERCNVIADRVFNSREEIEKTCRDYFKSNIIEGIVLITHDSKFSGKFMNDYYDSMK
jgi:hypothetical protein